MSEDLTAAISEALTTLRAETNHSIDELFGDHILDDDLSSLPPTVAHALGVIEGAGVALGLTALELLDALGFALH